MTSISEAQKRLGQALRNARESAGLSTRQVPKNDPEHPYFSSGHISLVEQGRTVPSPELVETYIKLSSRGTELSSLYEQMTTAAQLAARQRRRGGGSETPLPPPPQSMVEVHDRQDVQRHYVVQQNNVKYFFGSTGAIYRVECKVLLRAKAPGVRLCFTGYSYPADQRRGVLQIEAIHGLQIAELRESDNGAVQAFFSLDKALSPTDDPHPIEFHVLVDSLMPSTPHLRFHAEAGNRKLTLQASFLPPALPRAFWEIEAPSFMDAEHSPEESGPARSQGGSYSRVFDHLVPGWCYGFGWRW